MAAENIVDRIQDSFLSCSICFQPYNRPKALPCLHTFCEGCLRDYVTSRFEDTGQFPCPLCRQTIFIPPNGVTGLPDNHFIVGLGDTVSSYGARGSIQREHESTPLLSGTKTDHFSAETSNKLIRRFGSFGREPHEFVQVTGISISSFTDDIFLSDSSLNKISIYSSAGLFRGSFQCDCSVRDIAVTHGGTILVAVSRSGNAILREYTIDGRLLANHGTFYNQENPFGVTLSKNNYAVVTGLRQNCVHVLTDKRKPSVRFGSRGRGVNHFLSPYYVTMNNQDEIVIADSGNHRVKIHKLDGTFIHAFGTQGSKPGELFYPMGVCVDRFDNIYVADANNYRVQAFSRKGESLGFPVKDTYEYGMDVKPVNIVFSEDNVLLVVLRGTKFCQIHTYLWNVDKYKPIPKRGLLDRILCCK